MEIKSVMEQKMLDFNFEWFEQRDVGEVKYKKNGKLVDQKISDGIFKPINPKKTLNGEEKSANVSREI